MTRRNERGLWIALGIIVLLLFAVPMLGGWGMMARGIGPGGALGPGYGYGPGFARGGSWPFLALFGLGRIAMLLFWVAIIGFVVWVVRRGAVRDGEPSEPSAPPPLDMTVDPLAIAQRRYAAGEITREQFEEIRAVLREQQGEVHYH